MPVVDVVDGWGAIFCCDGAGCGDVCDPWCSNADPAESERFYNSQHTGVVDFSTAGGSYYCDDPMCACNRDYGADDGDLLHAF